MAKLITEILDSLQDKNLLEELFNNLALAQENLMKNYSNPVFGEKDRQYFSKKYGELENLGKSLYRYNTYLANDMPQEAQMESSEISDYVLKGGISNVKYVWHSENGENTCEECRALDGTEYEWDEEVPERPHPNCKCTVEIVEEDNIVNNVNENEENLSIEACPDCVEELTKAEIAVEVLQSMFALASYVINKLIDIASNFEFDIRKIYILEVIKVGEEAYNTYKDFSSNYFEMVSLNKEKYHEGSPEYFHRKANCQAAQRGELGVATAKAFGIAREMGDFYKEILFKGKTVEEATYNNRYDFIQNRIGRELGRNNPDADCEELLKEMMKLEWFNEYK